jgi:hypothetical protein
VALVGAAVLIACGWWLARNLTLYGDSSAFVGDIDVEEGCAYNHRQHLAPAHLLAHSASMKDCLITSA